MKTATFKGFCETCLPGVFHQPWNDAQRRAMRSIYAAATSGGPAICEMGLPRGKGNTSLAVFGALFAVLMGWHRVSAAYLGSWGHGADVGFIAQYELLYNLKLQTGFPKLKNLQVNRCSNRRSVFQWQAGGDDHPAGCCLLILPLYTPRLSPSIRLCDGSFGRPTFGIVDDPGRAYLKAQLGIRDE